MWKENKEGALLVVSFGTSYSETREKTIGAIEHRLEEAYPQYELRRAFTSRMILKVLRERDHIFIDDVKSALQRLIDEGCPNVVIQPTHMMNGEENDRMLADIKKYADKFESCRVGMPILNNIKDYCSLTKAVMSEIPEQHQEKTAVVLMGHGTDHHANSVYAALEYRMHDMGYTNVFVGTVEGYPDIEAVLRKIKAVDASIERIVLYPLMIVAGDHANNDMAGDSEDSWKSQFEKAGYQTECKIKGLGEYKGVQELFVNHLSEIL